MRTMIKTRNQNLGYWRKYYREEDSPLFVSEKTEFARCLHRERIDRVIIDFRTLDDSVLIEYLRNYYPGIRVVLLVGEEMKSAINLLQTRTFELIERDGSPNNAGICSLLPLE
jgi:hypothetical protein